MANSSHIARALLLAVLAVTLAVGVLLLDSGRRAEADPAAQLAAVSASATPATREEPATRAQLERPTGALVSTPAAAPKPSRAVAAPKLAGGVPCAAPHTLVRVDHDVPMLTARRSGRMLGTLPARSAYMGQPMTAWVQGTSADGAWGRITVPWFGSSRAGWARIDSLARASTRTMVVADLSSRRVSVLRGCTILFTEPAAIGASGSPSPTGRFFVTDRVAVPASQPQFGTFAFGLSAVQPNTPSGWTGGNQMAIHGTSAPSSIGTAASAGCLRVSQRTLERLKPLLQPGTPVVIVA